MLADRAPPVEAVFELLTFRIEPVVSEVDPSARPLPFVRLFQFQVCAQATLSIECVAVAALPFPLREPGGPVAQLVLVGADQPAGHHREGKRGRVAVDRLAGGVEAGADLADLLRGGVDGVVLVGVPRGEPQDRRRRRSSPRDESSGRRYTRRVRRSCAHPRALRSQGPGLGQKPAQRRRHHCSRSPRPSRGAAGSRRSRRK